MFPIKRTTAWLVASTALCLVLVLSSFAAPPPGKGGGSGGDPQPISPVKYVLTWLGGQGLGSTYAPAVNKYTDVVGSTNDNSAVETTRSENGNGSRGKKPRSAAILVSPTSGLQTTEAGGTAEFDVVLGSQPTADVTIDLTSSDLSEGSLDVPSVTFTPANWDTSQTVTVTGEQDTLLDGSVGYIVIAAPAISADNNYHGLDPDDVSITNIDDDSPATNTIYVRSFDYEMRPRGQHTEFQFIVDVRIDSDPGGVSEDIPAEGVLVVVSVYDSDETDLNNDSNIRNFLGTTNEEGIFRTYWYKGLKPGADYRIEVHDLSLSGYLWDPLDVLESGLDDEDEDGRPDFLLSVF